MQKWLEIKNKDDGVSDIIIDGVIGEFWDQLDPQSIRDMINKATGDKLTIKVFSPGGSFFVGQLFYNLLKETGKSIEVVNQGLVASAATFISCAGNFKMPKNANFMIHNPYPGNGTQGDANKLRAMADKLDTLRESLLAVYLEKSNLSREQLIEMMDNETWLTAEQALKYGFVDEILEHEEKIDNMAIAACIQGFKNMPQTVLNNVKSTNKPIKEGEKPMDLVQFKAEHKPVADQFKAEIQAENQTAIENAVKAERERILNIQESALDGQEALAKEAIENNTEAGAFAISAMKAYKQAEAQKGKEYLENRAKATDVLNNVKPSKENTPEEDIKAQAKAKEDEFFADFGALAKKGIK